MVNDLTPTSLSAKAGISVPYASQLLSAAADKRRVPSRALAIHIYRATGWRPEPIESLTEAEIDFLEKLEPWSPKEAA